MWPPGFGHRHRHNEAGRLEVVVEEVKQLIVSTTSSLANGATGSDGSQDAAHGSA